MVLSAARSHHGWWRTGFSRGRDGPIPSRPDLARDGLAGGAAAGHERPAPRRPRVDMTSLAVGWPAPLRLFMRVLVGTASAATFAALMASARLAMLTVTWPNRSY